MGNVKSVYLRNLVEDLWKKRKLVGICALACALLFAGIELRLLQNGGRIRTITEEEQQKIDAYNEKIASYDASLKEAEEGLALVTQQVEDLQRYVDGSIYMRIDHQNIQTASVQYGVLAGADSGTNIGNVLNALVLYINEGGLKEALDTEYKDLSVENWREIVSPSITANLLNITVIHYDGQQAAQILELIKKRVQEEAAKIAAVQGAFTLEEIDTTFYVKADVGVNDRQNTYLNNLKGYKSNAVDWENKLIGQKNGKENFEEKNKPEVLEGVEPVSVSKATVRSAMAGVLFGLILPALFLILRYLLSDRIRSKEDLRRAKLNVIGSFSAKGYMPALERSMLDVGVLAQQQELDRIFLNGMSEHEAVKQAVAGYAEEIVKSGLQAESGFHTYESAEELKKMAASKGCVLFVEVGKNTFAELEQQVSLCQRFKVAILGCVVIG